MADFLRNNDKLNNKKKFQIVNYMFRVFVLSGQLMEKISRKYK